MTTSVIPGVRFSTVTLKRPSRVDVATPSTTYARKKPLDPSDNTDVLDAIANFEQRLMNVHGVSLAEAGLAPTRAGARMFPDLHANRSAQTGPSGARTARAARQYGAEDVARELMARGEPCPPQRVAFLMHAHDQNHDGQLEESEFNKVVEGLHGDSDLHKELRYAWRYIIARPSHTKPRIHASVEAPTVVQIGSTPRTSPRAVTTAPTPAGASTPAKTGEAPPSDGSRVVDYDDRHRYDDEHMPQPTPPSHGSASHPVRRSIVKAANGAHVDGVAPAHPPAQHAPMMAAKPQTADGAGAGHGHGHGLAAHAKRPSVGGAGATGANGHAPGLQHQPSNGHGLHTIHSTPLAERVRDGLIHRMKRIIDTFHEWDQDHSLTISYDEFKKGMASIGITVTSEVEELWKSLDADGSGEIVYHELKAALTPHATPAKPSAQAMDPHNQRHDWHYSRQDWEQAPALIEGINATRDIPYSEQVQPQPRAPSMGPPPWDPLHGTPSTGAPSIGLLHGTPRDRRPRRGSGRSCVRARERSTRTGTQQSTRTRADGLVRGHLPNVAGAHAHVGRERVLYSRLPAHRRRARLQARAQATSSGQDARYGRPQSAGCRHEGCAGRAA
jgi:hypothetical protein